MKAILEVCVIEDGHLPQDGEAWRAPVNLSPRQVGFSWALTCLRSFKAGNRGESDWVSSGCQELSGIPLRPVPVIPADRMDG